MIGGDSTPASDRVREGWEDLPADSEAAVDYPTSERSSSQLEGTPGIRFNGTLPIAQAAPWGVKLPPVLEVDINVTLPDGRSFQFRESQEYELDGSGFPKYFEFEDAGDMISSVARTAQQRFE